jgi:hypothetical protein
MRAMNMDWTPKICMQFLAIGFLGAAGIIWIFRGDQTNAAWAFGAIAGYAFKNGANAVINKE